MKDRRAFHHLRLLGLVALVFGPALYGCADSPTASTVTAAVPVEGSSLPMFDPSSPDAGVGMMAPTIKGEDYDGTPVEFVPGQDPATLVVFVAHWCPHCQAEVPVIVDWLRKGGDLPVLLVSTAHAPDRGNWPPQEWLGREGWSGPVVVDDAELSALNAYGMDAFPAFAVVGSDGSVLARAAGPLGADGLDRIAAFLTESS